MICEMWNKENTPCESACNVNLCVVNVNHIRFMQKKKSAHFKNVFSQVFFFDLIKKRDEINFSKDFEDTHTHTLSHKLLLSYLINIVQRQV